MEVTTIKRNGVFIIFPTKENAPIKKNDIPAPVIQPVRPLQRKQIIRRPDHHRRNVVQKRLQVNGKKCWRCGEPVWRSDVNYCWECYKYENYESK